MKTISEPQVDRSQASEDYPLTAVPWSARKPIWSLAPLLMGFALTSTTLFAGGKIGTAFRFSDIIGIVLIGNLLLGVYCSALGYIAYKSGLSTVLMARFSFGNIGSRWVDFIMGFTQIGWYAFTNAFVAKALTELIGLPAQWEWVSIVFFTYAFCVTAYIGYTAMDWLSRLAVPAMLVLIALSLTLGFQQAGSLENLQAIAPKETMQFGEALTFIIGTFISGGTQATNWSRFANSSNNAIGSTLLAFLGVNGLLVFAGAFCTLVYGTEDLVQAMVKQGILLGGLVLLILNVWTTQDNTIYNFSVAGSNFFRTNKRTAFVLGGTTIALILALTGIYERMVDYLVFLGTVIPPVGGIIMADFWLKYRGEFPALSRYTAAFNWAGIGAYIIGAAIAYFTNQVKWGVPPINGIVSAAILYVVLSAVMRSSRHA